MNTDGRDGRVEGFMMPCLPDSRPINVDLHHSRPINVDLRRTVTWLIFFCLLLLPMIGCKSSHSREADTLAKQGSQMAGALATYYHQMAAAATEMPRARAVEDTLTAQMILPENTAALSQAYRVQAGHYAAREAMARRLKAVYDELGQLAEDKPDDVIGAATNLQSAIVSVNGGHHFGASLNGKPIDNALIQEHFDKAISFLFDLQKSSKLRNGNADTLAILIELKSVLVGEQALYAEDGSVFAAEGHSLAVAMTKAHFAASANHEALGASSPFYELLAPYDLQSTQVSSPDVANVSQVLTTFAVEDGYQNANAAASATPADLQALMEAQIARQKAFARNAR